jgi:hypothetical protein
VLTSYQLRLPAHKFMLFSLKTAKLRLAQLHCTDKAWRWFTVNFVVAGLGFKNGIACKLGAQVCQPFAHDVVVSITFTLGYTKALLSINPSSREPHFTGFASMPSFFFCLSPDFNVCP